MVSQWVGAQGGPIGVRTLLGGPVFSRAYDRLQNVRSRQCDEYADYGRRYDLHGMYERLVFSTLFDSLPSVQCSVLFVRLKLVTKKPRKVKL